MMGIKEIKEHLNELRDDCDKTIKIKGFVFTLAHYWVDLDEEFIVMYKEDMNNFINNLKKKFKQGASG